MSCVLSATGLVRSFFSTLISTSAKMFLRWSRRSFRWKWMPEEEEAAAEAPNAAGECILYEYVFFELSSFVIFGERNGRAENQIGGLR